MEKETKAIAKYIKISPNKLRRVANLIRGKELHYVNALLKNLPHKGAALILKVVDSAKANAIHNNKLDESSLYLKEVLINEGPRQKRFQPRARGRMFKILKRSSHIHVVVASKGDK